MADIRQAAGMHGSPGRGPMPAFQARPFASSGWGVICPCQLCPLLVLRRRLAALASPVIRSPERWRGACPGAILLGWLAGDAALCFLRLEVAVIKAILCRTTC